jgi:hypothetical protein
MRRPAARGGLQNLGVEGFPKSGRRTISLCPELFKTITDLVETGFGAGFVEIVTRSTADTNRPYSIRADFYSDRALQQKDGSLAKPPEDGVVPIRCAMAPLVSSLRAAPSTSTV